jgi:transaldolase
MGWVAGITTNPTLLAQADLPPEVLLPRLAQISPGPVFYQLTALNMSDILKEAEKAEQMVGKQLVLKIPPNQLGFEACTRLSGRIPCCVTAIYHPAQALVAQAAGAAYAVVYFHRAMNRMPDGMKLVREMAACCAGSQTRVLAASLKSADEVITARLAGIEHFTLPLRILVEITGSALSDEDISGFTQNGRGLNWND